jgi:hypothetical protein
MKKITILLAIVAFMSSVAFAGDITAVSADLQQSFKKNFPAATAVAWQQKDELNIAEFKENEIKHLAYFNADAKLVGVVRFVTAEYIPLKTMNILKEKYGDIDNKNVLEVSVTNGDIFYLMNIIHNNRFKTIKVYTDGTTEIIKKD